MSNKPPIFFHYTSGSFFFPDRERLKRFISLLIKEEGKTVQTLNYIFCDDAYLLDINKRYLKHFDLTDIITFELSQKGESLLGDIFISVERVRENAKTFKIPFKQELQRVIFHGALHLCGYKDKNKTDKIKMREMEDYYLEKYRVSRGTL